MNARVIVDVEVVVPEDNEMQAHLAEVLPLRALLSQRLQESCRLSALRDALLPKLISGSVRVKVNYLAGMDQPVTV